MGRVAQSVLRLTTSWTVRGSNPSGGRDFPPVQTSPGAHSASYTMGTGSFSGVKCGRGVLLTTNLFLAPRSWKSSAIPLPTLWATTGPVAGLHYLLFHACLHSIMKIIYIWIRLPKVECYFLMMDSQTIFETSIIHATVTRVITWRGFNAFVQALFIFGYKLLQNGPIIWTFYNV